MMNESFNSIRDTGQHAQVRHDLYEIIAMTIAAMIGNCDGWDEIEDFCQSKEMWLREHMGLELEHGIPSETTFARVWGQIDPAAFRACFTQWTKRVHEKLTGEVISIDGNANFTDLRTDNVQWTIHAFPADSRTNRLPIQ